MPLDKWGAKVLGTTPAMIDNAEDRNRHSAMLDELGIDQPLWSNMTTIEEAKIFCNKVPTPSLPIALSRRATPCWSGRPTSSGSKPCRPTG